METATAEQMPAFQMIPLALLRESPDNPRKRFDPAALEKLAENIREHGILNPLLVRPAGDAFEIGAGHRRFRAGTMAGLEAAPCIVRAMDDVAFLELLVVENGQREDVHPIEEAEGYDALMKRGGYDAAAIAAKVGRSLSYVYQRLKLLDLAPAIRKAFVEEKISAGHAILLARLQPEQQIEAFTWATDDRRHDDDDVASVRALSRHIHERVLLDLSKAPFDLGDVTLVKKVGACGPCPNRAGNQAELFADVKKGDTCTAPSCFQEKVRAHLERIALKTQGDSKKPVARIAMDYGPNTHLGEKRLPGVIYRGDKRAFRVITKDGCPHAEPAVVFQAERWGHSGPQLGAVVTVCRSNGCTKGTPRSPGSGSSHKASAAEREYARKERERREREIAKEKLEQATGAAALAAVVAKVPATLGPHELRLIALQQWERHDYDDVGDLLAERHGWVKPNVKRTTMQSRVDDKAALKAIEAMPAAELAAFIVECCLAPGALGRRTYFGAGSDRRKPDADLNALARRYRVDVDRVRKDAADAHKKAIAAAAPPATKKKAAGKAKAAKRSKKGKPTSKATAAGTSAESDGAAVDPLSVACPSCHADVGKACKRPSGHRVFGGGVHKEREAQARQHDPSMPRDAAKAIRELHGGDDDGPECEVCRCREDAACAGGCAWDRGYAGVGRYVCTTAKCVTTAGNRDSRLARKNGRTYGGPESVKDLHTSATG